MIVDHVNRARGTASDPERPRAVHQLHAALAGLALDQDLELHGYLPFAGGTASGVTRTPGALAGFFSQLFTSSMSPL